jgi:hypothetical protein
MTAPPPSPQQETRGFVGSLFDVDFHTLIAPKIIRVLYILVLVFALLYALGVVVVGIGSIIQGGGAAFLGVLLVFVAAPLIFLVTAAYSRVLLEVALVLFRIEENTRSIGGLGRGGGPTPPGSPQPPSGAQP